MEDYVKKLIIATGMCTALTATAAVDVKMYGFVKGSYYMTDSYLQGGDGSDNNNKPFFAENEDTRTDLQEEGTSQFTSTQSRWGFTANNGSKTSAKFEFDLDASQGSGAKSLSNGRIRQANLAYKVTENGTITIGKKWSKFMGVLPHTKAFTRVHFWAGNSGFLVDGLDYTHSFGNTSAAIELTNAGDADVNLVSAPTTTVTVEHKMGDHKLGLSHTMADLKYKTVNDSHKDSKASGTKVYWSGVYGQFHVGAEYTMGSNLGSIQVGNLAKATDSNDEEIKETAYMLTGKYAAEAWSGYFAYGTDMYNDEEEAGNGNVASNTLVTLGFDKKLDTGLTGYIEHQMFTTGYYDGKDVEDSKSALTEIGMVYKF